MNIDTGRIVMLRSDLSDHDALAQRLVSIDLQAATPKQREAMAVSLSDHTSTLGRQLTAARSKYLPHVGAKQRAKADACK